MAMKDYNGIAFKNTAIDRMSGRFGKGPGDGQKSASTSSTSSTSSNSKLLTNPWSKPKTQAVTAPSVKKPSGASMLKAPASSSTPSTNVSTVADRSNSPAPAAPAAPNRTVKDVKRETKIAVAEAKGKNKVANLDKKANMTPEQKMERREKKATNFGKAVRGAAELVGTAATTYLLAYNAGKKKGN